MFGSAPQSQLKEPEILKTSFAKATNLTGAAGTQERGRQAEHHELTEHVCHDHRQLRRDRGPRDGQGHVTVLQEKQNARAQVQGTF